MFTPILLTPSGLCVVIHLILMHSADRHLCALFRRVAASTSQVALTDSKASPCDDFAVSTNKVDYERGAILIKTGHCCNHRSIKRCQTTASWRLDCQYVACLGIERIPQRRRKHNNVWWSTRPMKYLEHTQTRLQAAGASSRITPFVVIHASRLRTIIFHSTTLYLGSWGPGYP